MSFEAAVKAAPAPVCDAYRPGKQALKGEHRDLIRCRDTRRFTGSIDLEAALADDAQAANLWDYGIGVRLRGDSEHAIWVEIHPAATTEVSTFLRKLAWLQTWLRTEAKALGALSQPSDEIETFVWIATDAGVHIRPGSPQARRLQQAGLRLPRQVLELC